MIDVYAEKYDLARQFRTAFRHFNEKLFNSNLPNCIITTQRHRGAAGFFAPDSYIQRKFDEDGDMIAPEYTVHEIAMMPDVMFDRTDRQVLSTLVHEMCHLWQQIRGKPSRNGYHNREWAKKMEQIGLMPSSLGELDVRNPDLPEDKKLTEQGTATGQAMSHYIIPDGPFDTACRELLNSGFQLILQQEKRLTLSAPKSKFKYTCPDCHANAWAKLNTAIICGECNTTMNCEEKDEEK